MEIRSNDRYFHLIDQQCVARHLKMIRKKKQKKNQKKSKKKSKKNQKKIISTEISPFLLA